MPKFVIEREIPGIGYCVYISPSEDLIRTHAAKGGFPANRISEVTATMDPTTAEG